MAKKSSTFTTRLIGLMKEHSVTVAEAAKISGVATSTIQSWRSGSSPTDFDAVQKLAQHFNVSLEYLLTGKEITVSNKKKPSLTEVFDGEEQVFDGYCRISIQRLLLRKPD